VTKPCNATQVSPQTGFLVVCHRESGHDASYGDHCGREPDGGAYVWPREPAEIERLAAMQRDLDAAIIREVERTELSDFAPQVFREFARDRRVLRDRGVMARDPSTATHAGKCYVCGWPAWKLSSGAHLFVCRAAALGDDCRPPPAAPTTKE